MDEIRCNCTKCAVIEKICRLEKGKGPSWCPTKKESKSLREALKKYDDPSLKEFARAASVQEGSCYIQRDVKPFVMIPTKTRLEELIEFSQRMGYKRLGLAFCGGLTHEASILSEILERHGFEIVSVSCKVGGVPKERIGVKDEEKIRIGEFVTMSTVMAVSAESPWKTIQEFVKYARKNPGLSYGHPGAGSSGFIRAEYFNKIAKLNMRSVPFKGDAEIIAAILGWHVPIAQMSGFSAKLQENGGKMRILLCLDPDPDVYPDVPGISSVFGITDLDAISLYLAASGKTPEEIV